MCFSYTQSSKLAKQPGQASCKKQASLIKNNRGQIVVEYILLLVIAVGIATLLTKGLVSRSAGNPGVITGAWSKMITAIGNDTVD